MSAESTRKVNLERESPGPIEQGSVLFRALELIAKEVAGKLIRAADSDDSTASGKSREGSCFTSFHVSSDSRTFGNGCST